MDLRLLDPRPLPVMTCTGAGRPWISVRVKRSVALAFATLLLTPALGLTREPSISTSKSSAHGTLSALVNVPGTLLIVGGGKLPEPIRRHFVNLAGGKNARIVIIPTASNKADQ